MEKLKEYVILWSEVFNEWCAINTTTLKIDCRGKTEYDVMAQVEQKIGGENNRTVFKNI